MLDVRDHHVAQLELQEVDALALSDVAHPGQVRLLDVGPGRAGEEQAGRRLADAGHEVEVLERRLAGPAATTDRRRASLADAPRPRLHVDLALVRVVGRFTHDPVELQEPPLGRHPDASVACAPRLGK